MSVKTAAELKSKFETGDQPTAQDFIDLVDSFLHAGLSNFPNPLPAVSGAALTNIGSALPDPLPARDGAALTNINPAEYNVPGAMPIPSYATATTFVLTGDWTVGSATVSQRVFLVARRVRIQIAGAYTYTEVLTAVFAAGITTVTLLDAMPGSPIQAVAVSVITPFALGGAVGPGTIGHSNLGNQIFTTGDIKLTLKSVADSSWVMMNDGSIGSATSGATTRANADTAALYTLLWNNISDAWTPVSSGRGASAAADFAANKTLTLPRALGRALAVSGNGSGLTNRALGEYLGAETHVLTTNEIPSHTHTISYSLSLTGAGGGGDVASSGSSKNTGATGGGAAHNNMQPSAFFNVMVKL